MQVAHEYSLEELVDQALCTLQTAGIELTEWKSLLYRRMGVPVIIKDYHYLVPDERLDEASEMLLNQGLPRSSPPTLLTKTGGDFYTKGYMHRLTRSTSLSDAQHLVIYPSSFASFRTTELTPAPRATSLSKPLCTTVLVPHPTAVYSSILRLMTSYSRWSPTRTMLASDLSELIGYNLYGLQEGYVDTDDEELCEELGVDDMVDTAVDIVKSWGCNEEWRPEEDWMGDALASIVSGKGNEEFLPWAP
ncbi:hypothetical protein CERSUDRAFT_81550 [Gelatoporia subvermispora B]|uniref:Uncharacterized protein n=1 Tax=Ceriporiopsis subvermispora (strain B) TaxID=914234 RepID=M2PQD0_CERS8|nr:hypothetical protein CERSUDRAFT_81550 [Gelatoporia subvermispora B]